MVVETLQYCLRQDINSTTRFWYCATSFLPVCVVHSFVFKASILYMCILSILILCLDFAQFISEWMGRSLIRSCAKLSYDHAQVVKVYAYPSTSVSSFILLQLVGLIYCTANDWSSLQRMGRRWAATHSRYMHTVVKVNADLTGWHSNHSVYNRCSWIHLARNLHIVMSLPAMSLEIHERKGQDRGG